MKKIIFIITIIFIFLFCNTTLFADQPQITIDSVTTAQDGVVKTTGTVLDRVENQQITITCYELIAGVYDISTLNYINQFDYTEIMVADGTTGEFAIELTPNQVLEANKRYIVRIGGTDILKPVFMVFTTDGNSDIDFIYGDADKDGVLTATDSAFVLQYALSASSISGSVEDINNFLTIINVTGEAEITSNQASYILQRVLNRLFEFPIEK